MPTQDDNFSGANCYIAVNPTRRFYLYGTDPEEIDIKDIANAISKQVRWTGHLVGNCWYSVAEHCILVQDIVRHLGGDIEIQYAALMHDSPEAYLADIAAPFKRELKSYYEKEELIWKRIAAKYHLPETIPELVKRADWLALFVEARFMVTDMPEMKQWVGWDKYGEEAFSLPHIPWMLTHGEARNMFLNRFNRLWTALNG